MKFREENKFKFIDFDFFVIQKKDQSRRKENLFYYEDDKKHILKCDLVNTML